MSAFSQLPLPALDSIDVKILDPDRISLSGTIAVANPRETLGDFFEAVHSAVVIEKRERISVDVTQLTFVNSSAIRLFVDWASWIHGLPTDQRYQVVFRTDRRVTWQRTSFAVLETLSKNAFITEAQ